nr:MAG TPA: hypothetical protein [Caudoviricetes sp.]
MTKPRSAGLRFLDGVLLTTKSKHLTFDKSCLSMATKKALKHLFC